MARITDVSQLKEGDILIRVFDNEKTSSQVSRVEAITSQKEKYVKDYGPLTFAIYWLDVEEGPSVGWTNADLNKAGCKWYRGKTARVLYGK